MTGIVNIIMGGMLNNITPSTTIAPLVVPIRADRCALIYEGRKEKGHQDAFFDRRWRLRARLFRISAVGTPTKQLCARFFSHG